MSADDYCKAAVRDVETRLGLEGLKLTNKAEIPVATNYRPELDVSEMLEDEDANYYQTLVGVLR